MNLLPVKKAIDYLLAGHITRDIIEEGFSLEGTVVYRAILAKRMGLEVSLGSPLMMRKSRLNR